MRISCSGQLGLHCPAVPRYSCTCRLQRIWCLCFHRLESCLRLRNMRKQWYLEFWFGPIYLPFGGKTWKAATARSNMRSKSRPKKWRRLQAAKHLQAVSPSLQSQKKQLKRRQYPTNPTKLVSKKISVSKNQLAAWFWWFRGMIDRQTHTQMMKAPWELQFYCRFQELLQLLMCP